MVQVIHPNQYAQNTETIIILVHDNALQYTWIMGGGGQYVEGLSILYMHDAQIRNDTTGNCNGSLHGLNHSPLIYLNGAGL